MTWLCIAFGVAVGSSLLPVVSIELFIITVMTTEAEQIPWVLMGAVVAVGHLIGKLPYYLAARGSIHLPRVLHERIHRPRRERPMTPRRERWQRRTKRVRGWLEALRERCHRHPGWMTTTYGVSSVVGLPPYMATVVLAGFVNMRPALFVGAGLAGRFVRFSILAGAPAVCAGWFGVTL
ncbi:hypothetical protein BJF85_09185 [Saccharomonospora sp. CUA-673]|nr:hypothetical protein BJF85_09185 [Saccharomonospora sp. CUA-673]